MLLRICLIVAILAGLAVGALNFVMVKDKITMVQKQREDEKTKKEAAQKDARETHTALTKTTAQLKQTETELAATKDERDKALADAADKTKRLDKTTQERDSARNERDAAQQELSAYKALGLKPEDIVKINNSFKGLNETIEGLQGENKLLDKKLTAALTELKLYRDPTFVVPLPANLKGKVLVMDPKWNFVILNIGQDQGVLEHGELLVNRNGKLVAKVVVRSVQKDRCVANILPGWQLGDVIEGDQVIPAHPAS